MKNKKLLISMSLLLATMPVFAMPVDKAVNTNDLSTIESKTSDVDESVKKKVLEIKKTFNITGVFEDFSISKEAINSDEYSDFFRNITKNKYINVYRWYDENLGSVEVFYTSDGDFISYSNWTNVDDKEKDNTEISYNDVIKRVEEFLPKIIKDFDTKYILDDFNITKHDGNYNFTYRKVINKIPSYDDTLVVEYSPSEDAFKNIVTLSNYGYSTLFLDKSHYKSDASISFESAKKTFLEKNPLTLSYKIENEKAQKVYHSEIFNIDAKTGNILKNRSYISYVEEAKAADNAYNANLTEVEMKKIKAIKDLKPQSDAQKVAKEILGDVKLNTPSIYSDKDDYFYQMNFEKKDVKGNITLNAKTLKLLNLNTWSDKKNSKINLKDNDAIKIASDFAKKYAETKEINFGKSTSYISKNYVEVFLPRYVNNLPVIDEGIMIEINDKGSVTSFSKNFSKVDFNAAKDISITKERANEIYLNSKDFGIKYQMTDNGPKLYYGSIKNIDPLIGADGILRDAHGRIVNFKEQLNYPDIDKARDKDKINKLKNMNIGLIGKNLSESITYKEFFELIGEADSSSRFFTREYKIDFDKIKDKKIPEKDIVKFLIIDNNLQEFTKAKGIFKEDIFKNQKDLSDYENYYIIAHGFGYIGRDVNPDKEISLEDVLYILYNTTL